jgi:hypothetical protein
MVTLTHVPLSIVVTLSAVTKKNLEPQITSFFFLSSYLYKATRTMTLINLNTYNRRL